MLFAGRSRVVGYNRAHIGRYIRRGYTEMYRCVPYPGIRGLAIQWSTNEMDPVQGKDLCPNSDGCIFRPYTVVVSMRKDRASHRVTFDAILGMGNRLILSSIFPACIFTLLYVRNIELRPLLGFQNSKIARDGFRAQLVTQPIWLVSRWNRRHFAEAHSNQTKPNLTCPNLIELNLHQSIGFNQSTNTQSHLIKYAEGIPTKNENYHLHF